MPSGVSHAAATPCVFWFHWSCSYAFMSVSRVLCPHSMSGFMDSLPISHQMSPKFLLTALKSAPSSPDAHLLTYSMVVVHDVYHLM